MEEIRLPLGDFQEQEFSITLRDQFLLDIKYMPMALEQALVNLDAHQLSIPYREAGWSIHQIAHHLADSHMNAFIRCKLILTEDNPVAKPYDQDLWANTADVTKVPVNISVTLLHALHARWHELFSNLESDDWQRALLHPEYKREMSLWYILGKYAWHSRHHVAQIMAIRKRNNW